MIGCNSLNSQSECIKECTRSCDESDCCKGMEHFSGQSYKHFTLVNYDSRVVIWGNFKLGTTLES